jgi:SAM-dependent methyltransferase
VSLSELVRRASDQIIRKVKLANRVGLYNQFSIKYQFFEKNMYSDLTIGNRFRIKRFSHQKRFDIAAELLDLKSDDSFLDYGTGDGYLLYVVKKKYQYVKRIVGFEPINTQFLQLSEFKKKSLGDEVEILNSLPLQSVFTKISCLEVLEHMTLSNQNKLLKEIRSLLTDDGLFVLSVPLEVGISGFLKNVVRVLLRQTHQNLSFIDFFKIAFCLKIDRPNVEYIGSHIGFNHFELEKLFPAAGFRIENRTYSPLPYFRGFANSQIFYLMRKI